jgi:hypothetical protein
MTTRIKQAHNHDPAQGAMFNQERAVSRRGAPETSKIAAASITPKKIREAHGKIIFMIRTHGSMTDYELRGMAAQLGWHFSWSGMSARRSELCPPRGYGLRDSGVTRLTPNKKPAIVWEIDPAHAPEVLPPKVRNLRQTQRAVLAIFEDASALGIKEMSHAQLVAEYERKIDRGDETEIQSDSSIRTRCAELVELKMVKRCPDSVTEKGNIAMWGLV